ncbi:MAG: DUF5115 domain-containing protein [Prevotella sp.]|nr:DUF5115 domain-containing protein [Prevotella sp.]
MKKILFLGGLLLAGITFVSCSDDYTDWADPQSYPQEDAITLPGFTASAVGAIDLANVEDGADIQVFSLATVALPDGASVGNVRMEISPADDASAEAQTIDTENGIISKEVLQAAVENAYGKRPTARTFNAQVYADIIIDGQSFLVDAGVVSLIVTPEAPFISSAYYLVGDMCGWDESTMIPFSHSDEDVYSDPVFTVTFNTTGGQYWKIIPQTNIDAGNLWIEGSTGVVGVAVDGDTSLSGTLVAVEGVGAGQVANAGYYKMTINMMDYTYTIEEMASEYYLTGNPNGWASDQGALFFPQTTTTFTYTSYYNGSWDVKFWAAADLGNWDYIYGCSAAEDNNGAMTGTIVYSNGDQSLIGCITPPSAGYYTLTIDMQSMTYSWTMLDNQEPTEYTSITALGDFNGWDTGAGIDLQQVAPHNWYAEATISSDGGVKFLADGSWDVNWGCTIDISENNSGVGVQNGDNMTVPAGNYRIYLNDITGEFVFISE